MKQVVKAVVVALVAAAYAPADARRHAVTILDSKIVARNMKKIREISKKDIIATIKGGYGLGLENIARAVLRGKPDMFAVKDVAEGVRLRKLLSSLGETTPILVLGGMSSGQEPYFSAYDLQAAVVFPDDVKPLVHLPHKEKPAHKVHLWLNTEQMNDQGILFGQGLKVAKKLASQSIPIEGVMTHLAAAGQDEALVDKQLKRFHAFVAELGRMGIHPKWKHARKTLSIPALADGDVGRDKETAVRPGSGLFLGVPELGTRDAVTLSSYLAGKLEYKKDAIPVGYHQVRVSHPGRKIIIGVLPLGYHDGVPKHLREVSFQGRRVPIVEVRKDQTDLDLTLFPHIARGTKSVILGTQEVPFSNAVKQTGAPYAEVIDGLRANQVTLR